MGFIRDLLAARDKIQEETQGSATSLNVSDLGVQMKVLIRQINTSQARIRPLSYAEKQSKVNLTPTIQANQDEKTIQIYNVDGKISVMSFNRVYDENTNQSRFFENSGVEDLLSKSLKGFTILFKS